MKKKRIIKKTNYEIIFIQQMVECVDCKRKVGKYRNSMLIHTSTHHCDQPIFECLDGNCNKKWYSLSARTKEHIEVYHGGNHSLLKVFTLKMKINFCI